MKLEHILEKLYEVNKMLRNEYTGLFIASTGEHYKYVWIRDVYYQAKPFLKKNPNSYIQTYRSLLDYYKGLNYKYDDKVDELLRKPFPLNNIRFIHPRFYPDLKEITGDWGNLQLDTFGYFFLGISEGLDEGLEIIRDDSDIEIINKLIKLMGKIEYWNIEDNGIWEEKEELHASSIGAVLAGLLSLEKHDFAIPRKSINEGIKKLNQLLPNESLSKIVDLSLLTLIYPFNILDKNNSTIVLEYVHELLERERGVIRYTGDKYFNADLKMPEGNEAEWTFGFAFLFFAYIDTDLNRAEKYLMKLLSLLDKNFYLPELFISKTNTPNENSPLGWTIALTICAIEKYISISVEKR